MHRVIAVVLFVLLACSGAAAGPLDDAGEAYDRGDYTTALRLIRPPAGQGNAKAQYDLGVMYAKSQGVAQDYTEAGRWYRKAAEQGNTEAQYDLGRVYDNGQGVPQNYAEAMRWYRKAAE